MSIAALSITDFRNLAAVALEPQLSGLNLICGPNGSGKTSLLEAIHFLSLGRSFRSASSTCLIRHETNKFSIFAQLLDQEGYHTPLGIERHAQGVSKMRIAEQEVDQIAALTARLPLRIINAQSHYLLESGPAFRRKYIDWGLFYESAHFLPLWRQVERILQQRNSLLRDKKSKHEIIGWTHAFIQWGKELTLLRQEYLHTLTPFVVEIAKTLLNIESLQMTYDPGWKVNDDLSLFFDRHYPEELRAGHTLYGPHRADIEFLLEGKPVKHFLSRGQQKLLVCAMIIAQGVMLTQRRNKRLIYLIDDLPSELDEPNSRQLIALLSQQSTQVFITAVGQQPIQAAIRSLDVPMKVFHVEHGAVVSA